MRRVKSTKRRSVPPVRTQGLFRWTALFYYSNESSRTDTTGQDWFSRSLSIILLHRNIYIFLTWTKDIIQEFWWLHDTTKPQPNSSNRRLPAQLPAATVGYQRQAQLLRRKSSEQGWYPNEMERKNNTTSGNNNNKRRKHSRRGKLYLI